MLNITVSLIVRETQTKTTKRCHLMSVGMATIKINTDVGEDVGKLEPLCNVPPAMENSAEVPQIIKD